MALPTVPTCIAMGLGALLFLVVVVVVVVKERGGSVAWCRPSWVL